MKNLKVNNFNFKNAESLVAIYTHTCISSKIEKTKILNSMLNRWENIA